RLGQRVRAFELYRILGREDEKRALEGIGAAGRRDVVLLHRLEQRSLRLRRRAVDLVRENDLREDRPFDEPQAASPLFFIQDLRARDVRRHQIRSELDALEFEIENVGQRLDQQRLREPRDARDEYVAAGEQRDQHLLDDVVLADDDFAQFGENAFAAARESIGADGNRSYRRIHVYGP